MLFIVSTEFLRVAAGVGHLRHFRNGLLSRTTVFCFRRRTGVVVGLVFVSETNAIIRYRFHSKLTPWFRKSRKWPLGG